MKLKIKHIRGRIQDGHKLLTVGDVYETGEADGKRLLRSFPDWYELVPDKPKVEVK